MHAATLTATVRALMADDKGLLAMDESTPTCNKRFAALDIPTTEEYRRQWRQLIVTAPSLGEAISGAILYDETIRQNLDDGTPMVQALSDRGIIPGIKVDAGTVGLPGHSGEWMTEGLDGLRQRLQAYRDLGARFAKWRAVIAVGADIPTRAGLVNNAQTLAIYAGLCQEADIVPIVEPEVLMDGTHSLERCREVTGMVLHIVFSHLRTQGISLKGMILKPNMVLSGLTSPEQASVEASAAATVRCLLRNVPAEVGGVAFLSGGQSPELATERLAAMHRDFGEQLPWPLTFSYSRAVQEPALELWRGQVEQVPAAQQALVERARANRAARQGQYNP